MLSYSPIPSSIHHPSRPHISVWSTLSITSIFFLFPFFFLHSVVWCIIALACRRQAAVCATLNVIEFDWKVFCFAGVSLCVRCVSGIVDGFSKIPVWPHFHDIRFQSCIILHIHINICHLDLWARKAFVFDTQRTYTYLFDIHLFPALAIYIDI